MAVILHIETSTNVCSVALSENNIVCFLFQIMRTESCKLLSPYIAECLNFLSTKNKTLDAVSVSSGPGSYTGLR
jgi:tRNA threonylcarbamoyladenosine biosynthesis protein TsaB